MARRVVIENMGSSRDWRFIKTNVPSAKMKERSLWCEAYVDLDLEVYEKVEQAGSGTLHVNGL